MSKMEQNELEILWAFQTNRFKQNLLYTKGRREKEKLLQRKGASKQKLAGGGDLPQNS